LGRDCGLDQPPLVVRRIAGVSVGIHDVMVENELDSDDPSRGELDFLAGSF
jgi:hypothetical protein